MLAVDFSPRWGPQSKAHRVAMLQAVSRQSPGETVFCGRHVHPLEASRRDATHFPIPFRGLKPTANMDRPSWTPDQLQNLLFHRPNLHLSDESRHADPAGRQIF